MVVDLLTVDACCNSGQPAHMLTEIPEYQSFEALAAEHIEGRDFSRNVQWVKGSGIAVIAPHGGRIEPFTDVAAANLAGADFSLYSFSSNLQTNEANLHIASHKFDDPVCLRLVAAHSCVVAIHGWRKEGQALLVGGLDTELGGEIVLAARELGINTCTDGGKLSGTHPRNICNRGKSGRGVQLEMSMGLRRSERLPRLLKLLREVLLHHSN